MKYLKLFEDEFNNFLDGGELSNLLKSEETYALYGRDNDDESYAKMRNGTLESCISAYLTMKKGSKDMMFEDIIIVKTNTTKEHLREDDIEAIIDAKKYNL